MKTLVLTTLGIVSFIIPTSKAVAYERDWDRDRDHRWHHEREEREWREREYREHHRMSLKEIREWECCHHRRF